MLTTRFVQGAPNWIDLATPDIDGAATFYGGLFGWRFASAGPGTGGYGYFRLGDKRVAGGMQTTPEEWPPSWAVHFKSSDADATARTAEEAHGSVVLRPADLKGQGRTAVLADRAGVPFGIWQPGPDKGLDLVQAPGALFWLELYTPDIAAAAGFYHKVLGWETASVTYPGGIYTCFNPAGQSEDTMFAGLVPLDEDPTKADAPYWLVYIEVTDADAAVARAQELGGSVLMPATDLPDVGRIAVLADPYGARFAVIKSVPPA
ncbi:VOC family protein [Streptomyces sp. NPDC058739]|uniref:VOC family protein n=1 Tax=Streptomyces sp. NPDC058739 TaxID=3346618 RepID=UPI0036D18287